MKNKNPFVTVVHKHILEDPALASRIIESMEEKDASDIIGQLPYQSVAEVVKHFSDSYTAALLETMPDNLVNEIAGRVQPEKMASILMQVSSERRDLLLKSLDERKKKDIQELLTYPEGSAGRLMTTKVIALHKETKIKDAIQKIKKLTAKGFVDSYVYITDQDKRLEGVMNIRDLLLAPGSDSVSKYYQKNFYSVNSFTDGETVAKMLRDLHFFALPVTDNSGRLLGLVKAESLIESARELTTEDIQKMFGASADERAFSPIALSIRSRLPWLNINLFTAFLAAFVVSLFEDLIAKVTVLAILLPVVAGQGGNAGAQSLAVVMRGLVMREIPPERIKELIKKETKIGAINGTVIGIVTGLIAWFWQSNPAIGIVIGLGMFVNLVAAGFAGAVIPIAMKKMNLDPAQSSSIILTTITDIVGFFSFLGFALLFQPFLL